MEIKRQSVAFNILRNFKETESTMTVESVVNTINDNFNKGFIDELTAEQAFEQIEILEKAMGHKYFKREGTPGNYKYYYTEAEYNKAKGKKTKKVESGLKSEIKVGDRIKGSEGVTKDRVGTVTYINNDMAHVDFGNGDKYGITLRRIQEGEFTKEELEGKKDPETQNSKSFNWDSKDAKILAEFGITKDNLVVKGNLNLLRTSITSLPEGLKVGGYLNLQGTLITSLPEGLKVGGNLYLSKSSITSLPGNLKVGGSLDLFGTPITAKDFKDSMEIGGTIYLDPKNKAGIKFRFD